MGKQAFSSGGAGRGRSSATGGGAGKAGGGASETAGKDWHSGGGAGKSSSSGGGGGGGGKSDRNEEGRLVKSCDRMASAVCIIQFKKNTVTERLGAWQQHNHPKLNISKTNELVVHCNASNMKAIKLQILCSRQNLVV